MIDGYLRDFIIFALGALVALLVVFRPSLRTPWKDPISWLELKPCQFCGSKDARLQHVSGGEQAFCYDCKAHGPVKPDGRQAADAWNGVTG